jgi:hypothetical protein
MNIASPHLWLFSFIIPYFALFGVGFLEGLNCEPVEETAETLRHKNGLVILG